MHLYQINNPIATIILAAGRGTRMKSSTPKILHKIAYKSIIEHIKDTALAVKSAQNILVINEELQEHFAYQSDFTLGVQKKQLGTADAVKVALKEVKDKNSKILIIYGDTPLIRPESLIQMINAKSEITVLAFESKNPFGYGRLVTKKDKVIKLVEEKDANSLEKKITLCNSGIMALDYKILAKLLPKIDNKNAAKEFYLTDIIKLGNLENYDCGFILSPEEEVLGINDRQQLNQADEIFQKRIHAQLFSAGVTLIKPETSYFAADIEINEDVIIHSNVVIGPNTKIGSNSNIHPFSVISDCQIGKNCNIGPMARIRPGSLIKDDVKIGNFVEVKNSTLEKGVKASHLSYIGDSYIKTETNIGAGVVTCNYDGYNKHKTKIGKNVFIGANSTIIAPITVADGAIVAAGSTITENVGKDDLALARSRQINKKLGAKKLRAKLDK